MFCKYCGEKLPDEARFCHKCGHKVNEPEKHSEIEINEITNKEMPAYPKKKKKGGRVFLILIMLLVIIGAVSGIIYIRNRNLPNYYDSLEKNVSEDSEVSENNTSQIEKKENETTAGKVD